MSDAKPIAQPEATAPEKDYVTRAELTQAVAPFITEAKAREIAQTEIKKLASEVTTLKNAVTKMETTMARLTGTIETLLTKRDADIASLQEGHEHQQKRLARLEASTNQFKEQQDRLHTFIYGDNGDGWRGWMTRYDSKFTALQSTVTAQGVNIAAMVNYFEAHKKRDEARQVQIQHYKDFFKSLRFWLSGLGGGTGLSLLVKAIETLLSQSP